MRARHDPLCESLRKVLERYQWDVRRSARSAFVYCWESLNWLGLTYALVAADLTP